MAPPNALFSTFSFIGFLFCAIPFYWHLEAHNVGTCLLMAWAGLACLNSFINSVVWNNTIANVAPVWCDISTRFIVGASIAIPAALFVINHRLYKIATRSATYLTAAEKRRDVYFDLAIGLGIPIIHMAMQLIVEGHRFDIFEEYGCYPNIYNTPPTLVITLIWPLIILTATAVYSCLNVHVFWKSSRLVREILGSNKSPNQSRYVRLIALSVTQLLCLIPVTILAIYHDIHVVNMHPWISWEDTHFNYSAVEQFPSFEWRSVPAVADGLELTRWFDVLAAFSFFAFFGFAEEARKHYRLAYSFASSRLGLAEFGSSRATASSPHSTSSSFGHGTKKGLATFLSFKDGFTTLGSRSQHGGMTERKAFGSVSDCRLTSDGSIFEAIDVESKGERFFTHVDDDALSASTHNVVTMPVIPRVPVPPPPVANPAGLTHIPPGRLDSPLPHRPSSSHLDVPEDV